MLHHVRRFTIAVVLSLVNIFTVGVYGYTEGEVHNHLHELDTQLGAVN